MIITGVMKRIIYAIELQLECPPPQSQFLICWFDREGNAKYSYVLGKRRMIDVRVRDVAQHPNGRGKIIGIQAWRQHYVEVDKPMPDDGVGFIVPATRGVQ